MKIKIGTRGSKLVLWQAHFVQDRLNQAGVEPEIITVETKGDTILDVSIAKIGSKRVFTEEIEELSANSGIDITVHSPNLDKARRATALDVDLIPGFWI